MRADPGKGGNQQETKYKWQEVLKYPGRMQDKEVTRPQMAPIVGGAHGSPISTLNEKIVQDLRENHGKLKYQHT